MLRSWLGLKRRGGASVWFRIHLVIGQITADYGISYRPTTSGNGRDGTVSAREWCRSLSLVVSRLVLVLVLVLATTSWR